MTCRASSNARARRRIFLFFTKKLFFFFFPPSLVRLRSRAVVKSQERFDFLVEPDDDDNDDAATNAPSDADADEQPSKKAKLS